MSQFSTADVAAISDYVQATESARTLKQLTSWDTKLDAVNTTVLTLMCTKAASWFTARVGALDVTDTYHLMVCANRVMAELYRRAGLMEGVRQYEKDLDQLVKPKTPKKRFPVVYTRDDDDPTATQPWEKSERDEFRID